MRADNDNIPGIVCGRCQGIATGGFSRQRAIVVPNFAVLVAQLVDLAVLIEEIGAHRIGVSKQDCRDARVWVSLDASREKG